MTKLDQRAGKMAFRTLRQSNDYSEWNDTIIWLGYAGQDTEKVKCEKKLEDEELLKLIAEPLKGGKWREES
jgi:hypothetical protein